MNKLQVLRGVEATHRVTSKDLARALRAERAGMSWFLLRLYRQALVSRELLEKEAGPGRRAFIYQVTERGRARIKYLESTVQTSKKLS